ncbi:hypothetical protein ANCCAN_08890 [Ancylostoma caninum]|uniref:Uncharacterized protein n=1 Tax=Ancylostoma caninum TaxID=29170 RepID=A0A368GPU9_ANCCA|nr:hypothetical protein ANCCAN_08890 [Ancylostoma caninum]
MKESSATNTKAERSAGSAQLPASPPMGCVRHSLITFTLFASVLSETLEVSVLKYDGLKSHHFHSTGQLNQFYTFQFCFCPRNVDLRSHASEKKRCDCNPVIRGKRVIDSVPHAVFSSSCIHKPNSANCLRTTFGAGSSKILVNGMNGHVFVRVSIGETIITQPEWQELPLDNLKNTYFIRVNAGVNMRLTYVSIFKTTKDSEKNKSTFSVAPLEKKKTLSKLEVFSEVKSRLPQQVLLQTERSRIAKAISSSFPTKPMDELARSAKFQTVILSRSTKK